MIDQLDRIEHAHFDRTPDGEVDQTIRDLVSEFGLERVRAVALEALGIDGSSESNLRTVELVLGEVFAHEFPAYALELLGLATGYANKLGRTVRSVAKDWGVTPAAVSKATIQMRTELHLSPGDGMKSETARESYRLSNRSRIKT